MNKAAQFFREAKAELMKVNWPSRQQTIRYTILVMALSIGVALLLGLLEYIFSYLLKTFIL